MKPILGITMGDPSGNGPEISVKALMNPETYEVCKPLIVGDELSLVNAMDYAIRMANAKAAV